MREADLELVGLDPGTYASVAFDVRGRRDDLQLPPARCEVSAGHDSIRLGLPSPEGD